MHVFRQRLPQCTASFTLRPTDTVTDPHAINSFLRFGLGAVIIFSFFFRRIKQRCVTFFLLRAAYNKVILKTVEL